MRVDCGSCHGKQDLSQRECLNGVVRLLARHPSAERIELIGAWEVGYGPETVSVLAPLATIVRSLEAVQTSATQGHACRQCQSSPANVIGRVLEGFPSRPILDAPSVEGRDDGACAACLNRTRLAIAAAGREYGKFESSLTRRVFKVVGGGANAGHSPQAPDPQA